MHKYAALLRGINVGKKKVAMQDLSSLMEKLGFNNVKTILATGNVVFYTNKTTDKAKLKDKIQSGIKNKFGFEVFVQIKDFEQIENIVKDNPFENLTSHKNIHWYVTFLNKKIADLPEPPNDSFKLLEIKDGVLFSILDRTKAKSTDFMTFLDKNFGKEVTTRNWKTLLKIYKVK